MPCGVFQCMYFGGLWWCISVYSSNGVAMIFFWGGPIFRDLRRPTRFGGGGGSSRNFPGSP